MLIFIPSLFLFMTALALAIMEATRRAFRFNWLAAVGGSLLALMVALFWLARMPMQISLPPWRISGLVEEAPHFIGDGLSWPLVFSVTALTVGILLTAVVRPALASSFAWAGTLALSGLGILAITADNPLTLLLIWAALDLTELITQVGAVDTPSASERAALAFFARVVGGGLLLWANVLSVSAGNKLDFESFSPQAALILIVAVGLRLGVLPLHLAYPSEPNLRRGFGTGLRFVSTVASLALLAKIPAGNMVSPLSPYLFGLTAIASLYGGWMWLRAPDELAGRQFWVIGISALAISSALAGNPVGAVAWSCALVLAGGAIILASVQHVWLTRVLLIGAWGLSSLPFSLTASVWNAGSYGFFLPFFVVAQSLLTAGFIRHAIRPGGRDTLDSQPPWTHPVYPAGIGLLVFVLLALGLLGWDGALQFGFWPSALAASLLTVVLIWAIPRLRFLNPIRAHWVRPTSSWLDGIYRVLWGVYQFLGRFSQAVTDMLEGAGGIMWTLLFLVLFISLIAQGNP